MNSWNKWRVLCISEWFVDKNSALTSSIPKAFRLRRFLQSDRIPELWVTACTEPTKRHWFRGEQCSYTGDRQRPRLENGAESGTATQPRRFRNRNGTGMRSGQDRKKRNKTSIVDTAVGMRSWRDSRPSFLVCAFSHCFSVFPRRESAALQLH